MPLVDYLRSQMRRPEGWFGKIFMGRLINRASQRLIENTTAALRVGPSDSILEIGFGGGAGLRRCLALAPGGTVYGIDLSDAMVEHVRSNFCAEIESGRLNIENGDVAHLPYEGSFFDAVFAVNNIYFWEDAVACLREIRRVLKDCGRIAIGNRSKEHMSKFAVTQKGFRLFSPNELEQVLREAGFREISVEHKVRVERGRFPDQVIAVGIK